MKTYLMKLIRNIHNFSPNMPTKAKIVLRILFVGMISIFLISQIATINLVNAETKYPKATELKYVNDYAKVLDSKSTQYILSVGKELEAKTGEKVISPLNAKKGILKRNKDEKDSATWTSGEPDSAKTELIKQ